MHIKLAKLFFILMFFYQGWYQDVYEPIPRMLLILGAPMMLMLVFHYFKTRRNFLDALSGEVGIWFVFAIISYISGIFIVDELPLLISSVFKLVQYLFVFSAVLIIADQDQSIGFFIKVFAGLVLLCAATTLIAGEEFAFGRISIGEKNPNALGLLMSYGIFCVLYMIDIKKNLTPILSLSSILLFIYVIILTGSRKSFLAALLLILFWMVFIFPKELRVLSVKRKVAIVSITLVTCAIAYFIAEPLIRDAILFERLDTLFSEGDEVRSTLVADGFRFFAENPIFGIGYDQYRELSSFGTYSHSTYAEAFACTGLVGAIIYFSVYVIILGKLIKIIVLNKEAGTTQNAVMFLALMGIIIFLAVGVIHFYNFDSIIMFGIIVAFCNITLKARKEQENEHKERTKPIRQKPQKIDISAGNKKFI